MNKRPRIITKQLTMQQNIEQPRGDLEAVSQSSGDEEAPLQQIGRLSARTCESLNPNNSVYFDVTMSAHVKNPYHPSQYDYLPIDDQLKQLFQTIQRYYPILSKLQIQQKAFIPDYIPSTGNPDPFLKMPRPDGEPQQIGLIFLDEPNKLSIQPLYEELKQLFKEIQNYSPMVTVLTATQKPFIPDYVPIVGIPDPFLKIPRPDKEPETLGLQLLDQQFLWLFKERSQAQAQCKSIIRKSQKSEEQKEEIKFKTSYNISIEINQQKKLIQCVPEATEQSWCTPF